MDRAYGTRKGFRDFDIEDSRSYKSRVKQQCPYCPKSLLHVNRHIMLAHREAYRARHAARSSYTKKIKQMNAYPEYSHRDYEASSKYSEHYMHPRHEPQRMAAPEPKCAEALSHHDMPEASDDDKPRLHSGRSEEPIKCSRCDTFMIPKLENIIEHQKHCTPPSQAYPQTVAAPLPNIRESGYLTGMSRGYPNLSSSSSSAHLNGDDGYPGSHQKSSYAVHPTSLTFTDVAIVEEFQRELMPAFTDSEVDIICKTDDTLILLGSQMAQSLKGYTKENRLYQTMAFMRNIADVYTHFDQYAASVGLQLQVIDMFHTSHLPLLDAVIKLETMSASTSSAKTKQDFFKSTLKSCIHLLKGWYNACKKEIFKKEQEIGNFETSFSSYWQNGMKYDTRSISLPAATEAKDAAPALKNGVLDAGESSMEGSQNISKERKTSMDDEHLVCNGEKPTENNSSMETSESETLHPQTKLSQDVNLADKSCPNKTNSCNEKPSESENLQEKHETETENRKSESESHNENTLVNTELTTENINNKPSTSSEQCSSEELKEDLLEAPKNGVSPPHGGAEDVLSPGSDKLDFFDSYIEDLSRTQAVSGRWDQGSGSVLLSEDFFEHPIFSRHGKRGGARRLSQALSVDSYCRPGKRRYLRWSSQDTVVILDSFSKYIVQEDEGCRGQLPGTG
ncbi:uncharacterized protein LOC108672392, partial [Hyalella azteca]|uniref:Uncharacterized protein LOC108672392 n=1 Tax=Hyalella azteca TaxID=294128 RepID=A0A979FRN3_HYAAZ